MINKIEISGIHADVDSELHKYVTKKIGKLDQYMSRHARVSAHAVVKLKEANLKTRKQATCEVILHMPNDTITTKESTANMYSAVDIVEAKLKNQLKKYKEKHEGTRLRRIARRLRRKNA